MNFHKTVGYLAAFLLMVGLGAPDSFAQIAQKKITLSVDDDDVREGQTVVVTVGLSTAPAAGTTVTVVLSSSPAGRGDDDDNDDVVDAGGRFAFPDIAETVTVTLDADNLSDDVSIDIVDDEVFTDPEELEVTLNAADQNSNTDDRYTDADAVTFIIEDDDDPLGTITISKVTPPSFDQSSTSQTAELEVTVELEDASDGDTAVDVTLVFQYFDAADAGQSGGPSDISLTITVPDEETSATAKFKAAAGDNPVEFENLNNILFAGLDEIASVKITGMAGEYVSVEKDVAVIDRVASTVQGFRVVMTGADEKWFGVKAKNVIVNLLRHRDIAFPWEQFESIEVVLRDSAEVAAVLAANADADITGQNIASVTVANMVGDLSFSTSYSPSNEYDHDGDGDTDKNKKSSVSDAVFASGGSSGIDTLKIRIGDIGRAV